MIRIFTRQIQKLGSEEGQALVFVAMVGVVIFLFFAMTMNLSEVINTKIKSQNVADAAALSASAWQARALNIVAGLNQNIYNHWLMFIFNSTVLMAALLYTQLACCFWTCPDNPACILSLYITAGEFFLVLQSIIAGMTAGNLQDEVLAAFDEDLILEDLPNVVDLNYEFKTNTQDLEDLGFLYAHDNEGNLFIDPNPGGGTPGNARFALTRAGWCELQIGLFYYACRNGALPECLGDWEAGFRGIVRRLNLNAMYRWWPFFPGECYQKTVEDSYFKSYPSLHPYVLMTYRSDSFQAQDPEELLPMTVGVYRQRMPPVLHLWGFGQRRDLNCDVPPLTSTNWFPCTDQAHFAFSTAHAYSQSVNDFYEVLNDVGVTTRYPVPLGFHEMDWQPRLYPMEPLQEEGEQSPECGWVAYENIADQIGDSLGEGEDDYLKDHVLEDPDPPRNEFFLY